MNRQPQDCPEFPQLQDFVDGRLDADLAARIEAHVASCETCGNRFRELVAFADSQSTPSTHSTNAFDDWDATAPPARDALGTEGPRLEKVDLPQPSHGSTAPRLDNYKLLQPIGEGGMGAVYMAEQLTPIKRRVAVKVIKPGLGSDRIVARFEAERQALALMDHQNIARVFDAGTTNDGRPFFVMELVKGVPITEYCEKQGLGLRERLELLIPVCRAVQHAHQKGVIHRDIKPSNVLVALYDGEPVPKVIDFGVAKATQQPLTEKTLFTEFGQIIGTLEYMSPEQAELNQLDVDTRSDVYSLGALLYVLLTGVTPLSMQDVKEAGVQAVLKLIHDAEPTPPSLRIQTTDRAPALLPDRKDDPLRTAKLLQGEVDWIAMKALEKERSRRYDSPGAMAEDMERYLRGDAINARPPSWTYRLRKAAVRHRLIVIPSAIIAILLLVAAIGGTWLSLWALDQKKAAVNNEKAMEKVADDLQVALQDTQVLLGDGYLNAGITDLRLGDPRDALWSFHLAWKNYPEDVIFRESAHRAMRYWGHAFGNRFLHPEKVEAVRIRDDGQQVATASRDGAIWFWSAETGRPLHKLTHPDRAKLVDLSGDWSRAVCVFAQAPAEPQLPPTTGVRVWDVSEERVLHDISFDYAFVLARLSPDGKTLLTVKRHGPEAEAFELQFWDAATGQRLGEPVERPYARRLGAAFSPDSKQLAYFYGEDIEFWRVADQQLIEKTKQATPIRFIQFETNQLYTFADDGVRACDISGLELSPDDTLGIQPPLEEPAGQVRIGKPLGLAGGANFGRVYPEDQVAIGVGPRLDLLDLRTKTPRFPAFYDSTEESAGYFGLCELLPRRHSLLTTKMSSSDIEVRSAFTGKTMASYPWHHGKVTSIDVHASGIALSGSEDHTAQLTPLSMVEPISRPVPSGITPIDVRDGLAVVGNRGSQLSIQPVSLPAPNRVFPQPTHRDTTATIWDLKRNEPIFTLPRVHQRSLREVRVSPDGTKALLGSFDNTASLWDLNSGKQIGELLAHGKPVSPYEDGQVWDVAFSPDSKTAFTAGRDGVVNAWRASTGEHLFKVRHGHEAHAIACSPDGKWLATGGEDRMVRVWRLTDGTAQHQFQQAGPIEHLVFVDSQLLAAAGEDIRIWNVETGKAHTEAFHLGGRGDYGYERKVSALAVSHNKQVLATGGMDKSVRLWSVATGKPLAREKVSSISWVRKGENEMRTGPTDGDNQTGIAALAFDPNDQLLISGDYDGNSQIWDVATGIPLGPPRPHHGAVRFVAIDDAGAALVGAAGTLYRAEAPPALTREPKTIDRWVRLQTHWTISDDDLREEMDFETWLKIRKSLATPGGLAP